MFTVGVSRIRTYGPGVLACLVIALLAGALIDRRILTAHSAGEVRPLALIPGDNSAPGFSASSLRRIVLDPCTGLEKPQTRALTAKAD